MNILTACDSRFYHCLVPLVKSVKRLYGKLPIVYDLGMTETQIANLGGIVRHIDVEAGWDSQVAFDLGSAIATVHKPMLIKDYFDVHDEPVMYVDADCLFTKRVDIEACDLGVCLRWEEDRNYKDIFTGLLNAGVMYFARWTELMEDWKSLCEGETTDQKAMNEVLTPYLNWRGATGKLHQCEDTLVRVLPCSIYNDYRLGNGSILHFKSGNHRPWKYAELLKERGKEWGIV